MFSRALSTVFPSSSSSSKKKVSNSCSKHETKTPEQRAVRREERCKRKETEAVLTATEFKRMSGISSLRWSKDKGEKDKGKLVSNMLSPTRAKKGFAFMDEVNGVRRGKMTGASKASENQQGVRANKYRVYMTGAAGEAGKESGLVGEDLQIGILSFKKDPLSALPKDQSSGCNHYRAEYEDVEHTVQCEHCVRKAQRKREEEEVRGRSRDYRRKRRRREKPKSTVTCISCLDDEIPASEAAYISCSHYFCHDCLIRLFTLSLTDPAHMPPKCCTTSYIPLHHVSHLLPDQTKRLWNRKYREFTTQNRVYCSLATCGEWVPPERINNKLGKCKKCGIKTCSMCNGPAHGKGDCPQDPDIIKFIETAEKEGYQRCYNCKSYVELERGCNHMRCRCRSEFCYLCGLKWKTCSCPWFNPNPQTISDPEIAIINDGHRPLPAFPLQHFLAQIPVLLPLTLQARDRARQIRTDARLARRLERELRLADGINLSDIEPTDADEDDLENDTELQIAATEEWERQRMRLPEGVREFLEGGTPLEEILNGLEAMLGIRFGARNPSSLPPRPPIRDPIRLPPTPPPPPLPVRDPVRLPPTSPPPWTRARERESHRQLRRVPSATSMRRTRRAKQPASASAVNSSRRGGRDTSNGSRDGSNAVREREIISRSRYLSDNQQNAVERFLRTLPEDGPPGVEKGEERAVRRERRRGGERGVGVVPGSLGCTRVRA